MGKLLPLVAVAIALPLLVAGTPVAGGGSAVKNLPGCTTSTLAAGDDIATDAVLGFEIDFFGQAYSNAYVSNNGNITLDSPLSSGTPIALDGADRRVIAPLLADVDTRGGGAVSFGTDTFDGHPTFCVEWLAVGYYNQHTDKLNTFQLLIVNRDDVHAGDFDIIFNYGQVQWETGDASGGHNGLGGTTARSGYTNGVDHSFEIEGSGVPGAFLDDATTGLAHTSYGTEVAGRYVFPLRNGATPTPTPTAPVTPATATPTATPSAPEGDANCNEAVDSIDVLFILQYVAGLLSSLGCPVSADVNDDGVVNSIDAALILQYVAGLLGSL